MNRRLTHLSRREFLRMAGASGHPQELPPGQVGHCLLYTSDAADE